MERGSVVAAERRLAGEARPEVRRMLRAVDDHLEVIGAVAGSGSDTEMPKSGPTWAICRRSSAT